MQPIMRGRPEPVCITAARRAARDSFRQNDSHWLGLPWIEKMAGLTYFKATAFA